MKVDVNNVNECSNSNLSITDLTVYLNKKKILNNISFTLKQGTILGIMGPNGSGKTTLLKAIVNLVKSDGDIILNGKIIKKLSKLEIAKNISFLPQVTELFRGFKSFEVVLVARYPHNSDYIFDRKEDIEKTERILEITGTMKYRDKYLSELSSGERGMVLIARALAQEGKLLLLDEPTAHLDVKNQLEIMDKLRNIVKTDNSMAIVTFHDITMCKKFSDVVIMLRDGSIITYGKTDEVVTEENIKRCFDVDLDFNIAAPPKKILNIKHAHIICGAGSGKEIAKWFKGRGVTVTMGILSPMDSDYIVAKSLSINAIVEEPFRSISPEMVEKHKKVIEKSSIVIITDFPVGNGNIDNIDILLHCNKQIFIIEKSQPESRDYTADRRFTVIWNEIKKKAKVFNNENDFYNFIEANRFE
jgi:iron complex transport system ATP-binding protein